MINKKKYSQFNLDQFKNWLRDMKEKNQPKYIEVYVDDLKVVPKTDNPDEFDSHQQYVDDETMKVRVLIYNTIGSNRYTQTIFTVKEEPQQTLGEVEVQRRIDDGVNLKMKALEEKLSRQQLEKDLAETKAKLKESEEWADRLNAHISELKEKLENAKGWKEVLSLIEGIDIPFLKKKNPGNQLSGQEEKKPEEQASFKRKTEGVAGLSEDEKHFLNIGRMLEEKFTKEELLVVYPIIDALAGDKANINPVAELLNINNNQKQNTNGKI